MNIETRDDAEKVFFESCRKSGRSEEVIQEAWDRAIKELDAKGYYDIVPKKIVSIAYRVGFKHMPLVPRDSLDIKDKNERRAYQEAAKTNEKMDELIGVIRSMKREIRDLKCKE